MRINVGSQNELKISAVRDTLQNYESFRGASIVGVNVVSGVSNQPISLEEIVKGARNRAKLAYGDCAFSVGIESGLMSVPLARTGYMEKCICAVYNGNEYYLGGSCSFELPPSVIRLIVESNIDLNKAFHFAGLTAKGNIGTAEGAIGLLTRNRITRKDYIQDAFIAALIQLENKSLYNN